MFLFFCVRILYGGVEQGKLLTYVPNDNEEVIKYHIARNCTLHV